MGEREQAIDWLERAYEKRDSYLPFFHVDPRLANLQSDPRFTALMKRIGFEC
jgi:hypothetical protein